MSAAEPSSFAQPSPEEIAARHAQQEEKRLAWCERAINVFELNRYCQSAYCRRHGCGNVRRCEPQRRAKLNEILVTLMTAQMQESSLRPETPDPRALAARKELLAYARKNGILPLEEFRAGDPNAPERSAKS